MLWENLREEEFVGAIERSGGLCVLPIGCLEKHGQHLPVGTDGYIAKTICQLAAQKEEAVVFPNGMWLGDMIGQHAIDPKDTRTRGAIALNPHTILTVLGELCDEIARNGFRKILIVNSHGGNNPMLDYFLRAQRYEKKNYATLVTSVSKKADIYAPAMYEAVTTHRENFPMITEADIALLETFAARDKAGEGDGHAGFRESALMMGIVPEYCRVDKAEQENGVSTHVADYLSAAGLKFAPGWGNNYPNCNHGYGAVGCTPTIGQAVVQICVERMAGIYKLLKEDEKCVRMAQSLPLSEL